MSVKFFGQFLIERGELQAHELRKALEIMESENRNLGELAIASGFASAEEVRRVNGAQRRRDVRFGELAVQMGVLNSVELEELLAQQQSERVNLEDAIARLEILPVARMQDLLEQFALDQAPYTQPESELPGTLASNRVATLLVDLMPRFCMRIGGAEVKLGPGRPLQDSPDLPHMASLEIAGSQAVTVALATDSAFGERLASGVSGIDVSTLAAELATDALGEFLNVIAGNVVGALEKSGFENRIEAPRLGALPTRGYAFDLVANEGRAVLVLDDRKS